MSVCLYVCVCVFVSVCMCIRRCLPSFFEDVSVEIRNVEFLRENSLFAESFAAKSLTRPNCKESDAINTFADGHSLSFSFSLSLSLSPPSPLSFLSLADFPFVSFILHRRKRAREQCAEHIAASEDTSDLR